MRPYIQGLDEIEFSNLMRNWFKHDHLKGIAYQNINKTLSPEDISLVIETISALEDTIRNELYGYAKELEDSKTKLEAFLDGVDFALRPTKDEDV
jgi:hypothetical protein